MKILLTGASGYVAKNLQIFFLKKKYKVFAISRKRIKLKNSKVFKIDISSRESIKKIKLKQVDYIIHTSFIKKKIQISESNKLEKNLNIANNLVFLLKKLKFKKLINLSTSSLYPNTSGNFNENAKINFLNNNDYDYALAKYYTETILNLNFPSKKLVHLRIGQIFGNSEKDTILSKMRDSIKKKNCIIIFGNGKRKISIVHIDKLIKYIFLTLKKNISGTFNVADYNISLNKLSVLFKNKYGDSKTKIKIKNLISKNPRFKIIVTKFFNNINLKQPRLENILNEI